MSEHPRAYEAAMCVLLHWKEHHTPATVRDVATAMDLASHSTAWRHLQRAARMGLIDMRGNGVSHSASLWPKDDCVCPTCGASHVRETA